MGPATFVAGDWGTSHLRLFLCDARGEVIDSLAGPGATEARNAFPNVFDRLLADWARRHGALPAVLCGMVGSSFGWAEAPYVACPARPEQVAAACVELRGGRVRIVPGLSCRNRFDAPDVMRGEETQILGALHLNADLRHGRHLLCLPGTHTKWAVIDEGSVQEFLTSPTGELYTLLCNHSVLVSDARDNAHATTVTSTSVFERGLAQFERFPAASLLHRIFECRSRRLSGELRADDASSYLSGLLIASDTHSALELYAADGAAHAVQVIGTPLLTERYAKALAARGRECATMDGAAASLAGLAHLHQLVAQATAA